MVEVAHQWNPDDWEVFSLCLLQCRHGTLGIHKIPSTHKGDLGIDFYSTDESIIYQCYAAEEPIDIATRAARQKSKITTDLNKIISGASVVHRLLLNKPLKKWCLLVPLHDSKDVNTHCANKTIEYRSAKPWHLDADFEVCIHDQGSFPGSALQQAMSALTSIFLSVGPPSTADLEAWQADSPDLLANARAKLSRRAEADKLDTAVAKSVEAVLISDALIDALRTTAPELHEKVIEAIKRRANRLAFAGPQGGPVPTNIMNTELDYLTGMIKVAAPSLSEANVEEIAMGAISEWIMRCPLDFPADAV